jgi:ketosteroid isomerase-like protein
VSSADVDVVRRLYDSFRSRGFEATLELVDPEIVWEDLDELPGATVARGHDELRRLFTSFYEAWDDLSFTPEEFIDAGGAVIVAHRWRATGRSSGTPIDTVVWNVIWLRDGRIVHRRAFQGREAAFAAAGSA